MDNPLCKQKYSLDELVVSIQPQEINSLELAKVLQLLIKEYKLSQEELAQKIGKKRSTITNYLRLLSLPQIIQDSVSKELISIGHAKTILSLSNESQQCRLHDLILSHKLTVRQAEQEALAIEASITKEQNDSSSCNLHLRKLAEKMQHKLGTKVQIQGKGDKGRITIDYYNLDDLDRVLEILLYE